MNNLDDSKQVTGVIIGAGNRGQGYASYALEYPEIFKVVAVAEPKEQRREKLADLHDLPQSMRFETYQELFSKAQLADVAIICTQDQMHTEPAVQAMNKGYDVLLEKPMAVTVADCKKLVKTAEKTGKLLQICHVLRFTNFAQTLHNTILSGKIGEIVTISWRENVSHWHYAHSYIRGHWHNRKESSPMILAKSCHDLDILFWLVGTTAKTISSFGSQKFFGRENQPKGAPDRCLDGCPAAESCLYYAPRLYLDIIPLLQIAARGGSFLDKCIASSVLKKPSLRKFFPFSLVTRYTGFPINVITEDSSFESRKQALEHSNWGKCVYAIDDHDVIDHQVTIIEFANGVTADFTLQGFSPMEGRTCRIDGTKGVLYGEFLYSGEKILFHDAFSNKKEIIYQSGMSDAHGGGDQALMDAFISNIVKGRKKDPLSDARGALESHLLAFAADESRLHSRTVHLADFR